MIKRNPICALCEEGNLLYILSDFIIGETHHFVRVYPNGNIAEIDTDDYTYLADCYPPTER